MAASPSLSSFHRSGYHSPLHAAVRSDQVETVRSLILGGADPNLQDCGHTPLQVAALQGQLRVVQALIELGGEPNVLTSESTTLLHLAVLSKNPELIQFLLNQPSCKVWLTHRDFQCKTPYDKAVQLHLSGEIIDMLDPTPFTSACSSLTFGPFQGPSLVSSDPSLLTQREVFSSSQPDSIDQNLERAFKTARDSKDLATQISALVKLSDLCVEEGNYIKGARLLNAALSLVKRDENPEQYENFILKLEEIEKFFLKSLGGTVPVDYQSNILRYRKRLEEVRKYAQKKLEKRREIKGIQADLTREFKAILKALIKESNRFLGRGLQDFTVIVFGSMAREEACPYSDLEFAFLTRNLSPENLDYLRKINQFLTLKVINMGETHDRTVELPPSGFSVDIGGNSPQGGAYGDLIGSPSQLAEFQSEEWYRHHGDSGIPTANAIRTASYLMGNESLFSEYQGKVRQVLERSHSSSTLLSPVKLRENQALQFIRRFVDWFAPRLDQSRVESRFFNIKEDFYRLPQVIISALALYFGVTSTNTFDQLEELNTRGIISVEGTAKLKELLEAILRIRVKAHLFYKTEKEDVSRFRRDERLLRIREEELIKIYRILIPFHKSAQDFLSGNREAFAQSTFYDKNVGKTALEKAILRPSSSSALSRLGREQKNTGEIEASVTNFEAAMALFKGDQSSLEYGRLLKGLGETYLLSGAFEKAVAPLTSALSIYSTDRQVAFKILAFLGEAYFQLGQFDAAIDCCKKSQSIYLDLEGEDKSDKKRELRNRSWLNEGFAHYKLGDFESAVEKFKLYLEKKKRATLYDHPIDPSILHVMHHLSSACLEMGDKFYNSNMLEAAEKPYESSLKWKRRIYQDPAHPEILTLVHRLGNIYRNQGNIFYAKEEFLDAIIEYESLLELQKKYHPESSPEIISTLELLADANFKAEYYDNAIELYEILLPIQIRNRLTGPVLHPLSCLGESYYQEREKEKSIKTYETLLEMQGRLLKRPSLKIAETLTRLAGAYRRVQNLDKAVEYCKASLEERRGLRKKHGSAELEASIKKTKSKRDALLKEIRKAAH